MEFVRKRDILVIATILLDKRQVYITSPVGQAKSLKQIPKDYVPSSDGLTIFYDIRPC